MTKFEKIDGIKLNKLSAKSKRIVNRIQAYLDQEKKSLLEIFAEV